MRVPATRRPAVDPWTGISEDVIRRFFDVLCIERGMPKACLSAYRADLYAFDRWLIEAKRKTLISATQQDVSEYLTSSTASIEAFYGFLVNSAAATTIRRRRLPNLASAAGEPIRRTMADGAGAV